MKNIILKLIDGSIIEHEISIPLATLIDNIGLWKNAGNQFIYIDKVYYNIGTIISLNYKEDNNETKND